LGEQKQKKKKKKKQLIVLEPETVESDFAALIEVLEELIEKEKYMDIQICPNCKSPKVRRVTSMEGDMLGHMGLAPPKYECLKCGWREKLVVKATNKPTTMKDVVLMAEANEAENEK
jgi:ribosomal protein L37AE/L43A